MNLKEYIELLQTKLKEHGDIKVLYSCDDEGNYYSEVHYLPSVGFYNEKSGEFDHNFEGKVNAICLN